MGILANDMGISGWPWDPSEKGSKNQVLGLFKSTRFSALCTYQSLLSLSAAFVLPLKAEPLKKASVSYGYGWVSRYFDSIPKDVDLDEVVDFLVSLRTYLEAQGHAVPKLSELCADLKESLLSHGIEIDENGVKAIYDRILDREELIFSETSHFSHATLNSTQYGEWHVVKNDKEEKEELKTSGEFAVGFCKFLAGALCCIIPHPTMQIIGTGMIIDGVKDMIDHAGDDPDQESLEERMRKSSQNHK